MDEEIEVTRPEESVDSQEYVANNHSSYFQRFRPDDILNEIQKDVDYCRYENGSSFVSNHKRDDQCDWKQDEEFFNSMKGDVILVDTCDCLKNIVLELFFLFV